MKRAYWIYGYLIGYLSMQFHEMLHWITAKIFGFGGTVAIYSYSMSSFGEPWRFIIVSLAGTASTIISEIVGLVLFRSKKMLVKRTGFILIVINSVGRVLYEFSAVVIGASGDEASAAQWLGIHSMYLRIPVTLFCMIVLTYVIWEDTQTGFRTVGWIAIFVLSFVAVIITVLSLGSVIDRLISSGNSLLQVNLSGYPLYLLALNAVMLSGTVYLVVRRARFLRLA